MGHMPKVESQAYHGDVKDPPARFIPHKIFEHSYLQRRCPRAYTTAMPKKCITHHPAVKKDIFLEILFISMLLFSDAPYSTRKREVPYQYYITISLQEGCHEITYYKIRFLGTAA
jgi:hypothetical protein